MEDSIRFRRTNNEDQISKVDDLDMLPRAQEDVYASCRDDKRQIFRSIRSFCCVFIINKKMKNKGRKNKPN